MNADFLAAHERVHGMRLATCMCGWEEPIRERDVTALHAAHVAAVWREHRTIRTEKELDELPEGAVLSLYNGEIVMLDGPGCGTRQRVQHWAWSDCCGISVLHLPAVVRYRPDEDGAQP